MQSVLICGRLCRDPEVRYTGTGDKTTSIARFTVAVNRLFKREGKADADFFNCVCFGKNASFAEKYLTQGAKVVIRGRMEQDDYTNKDGQKVYTWNLNVDEIDFGESKRTESAPNDKPAKSKKAKAQVEEDENGFMNIPDELDEDMPFN